MKYGIPNPTVEGVLRTILTAEGFELSPRRGRGETGTDILAARDGEEWFIEVIGYKRTGPARAKDFFQAFFQAVSRLNLGARRSVIAMATQARRGLPARARQHQVAWKRIAAAFPELSIWLVDTERNTVTRHSWGEWLQVDEAVDTPE